MSYCRFGNIGKNVGKQTEPHCTPLKFCAYIIGRRLPDEVVHRIRLRIDAGEEVAEIAEAVKVSKKTIYKLQLNLDIWVSCTHRLLLFLADLGLSRYIKNW